MSKWLMPSGNMTRKRFKDGRVQFTWQSSTAAVTSANPELPFTALDTVRSCHKHGQSFEWLVARLTRGSYIFVKNSSFLRKKCWGRTPTSVWDSTKQGIGVRRSQIGLLAFRLPSRCRNSWRWQVRSRENRAGFPCTPRRPACSPEGDAALWMTALRAAAHSNIVASGRRFAGRRRTESRCDGPVARGRTNAPQALRDRAYRREKRSPTGEYRRTTHRLGGWRYDRRALREPATWRAGGPLSSFYSSWEHNATSRSQRSWLRTLHPQERSAPQCHDARRTGRPSTQAPRPPGDQSRWGAGRWGGREARTAGWGVGWPTRRAWAVAGEGSLWGCRGVRTRWSDTVGHRECTRPADWWCVGAAPAASSPPSPWSGPSTPPHWSPRGASWWPPSAGHDRPPRPGSRWTRRRTRPRRSALLARRAGGWSPRPAGREARRWGWRIAIAPIAWSRTRTRPSWSASAAAPAARGRPAVEAAPLGPRWRRRCCRRVAWSAAFVAGNGRSPRRAEETANRPRHHRPATPSSRALRRASDRRSRRCRSPPSWTAASQCCRWRRSGGGTAGSRGWRWGAQRQRGGGEASCGTGSGGRAGRRPRRPAAPERWPERSQSPGHGANWRASPWAGCNPPLWVALRAARKCWRSAGWMWSTDTRRSPLEWREAACGTLCPCRRPAGNRGQRAWSGHGCFLAALSRPTWQEVSRCSSVLRRRWECDDKSRGRARLALRCTGRWSCVQCTHVRCGWRRGWA